MTVGEGQRAVDRRYQVFVSSTFVDLEEARREVSTALLKSDCFPAGMELFPAADMEQFEYIKQIIDGSDYFLVISAGKYGSIHSVTGLSYSEMEYDHAVSIGKPIIRLLHKNPFKLLPGEAIEESDKGRKKLQAFREKLSQSRLVDFWGSPKDLGQKAILALLDIKKRRPSDGWVRGNQAITIELLKELETLRSAVRSSATVKSEGLVSFDKLTKETELRIFVASSEEGGDGKQVGIAQISSKLVAEAVFLALLSHNNLRGICEDASDSLAMNYSFQLKHRKYAHCWFELPPPSCIHFLHYLESRGLVRGPSIASISHWELTQRGRLHATSMSSLRNLG